MLGNEPVPLTHHSLQIPRGCLGNEPTPSWWKRGD